MACQSVYDYSMPILVVFYGVSTFVGYLIPNPVHRHVI